MTRVALYVGETGRDFDGVAMFRICRGCNSEYFGPAGYCKGCEQLNEQMEERFCDHLEAESDPRHTVIAPPTLAERMWPLSLLIVLGGIAYMEWEVARAVVEFIRQGAIR